MEAIFEPIEVQSLKEACLHQLEGMIFSGRLIAGEKLPSERQLATQLGVSRPILHQALVELEMKGLVEIIPRKGVYVCDYRQAGSIASLASYLSYHQGEMNVGLLSNLFDFRKLLELEIACLAANHRTQEQLESLKQVQEKEIEAERDSPEILTELDFSFHMQVAYASGNLIYPLIMNSFSEVYKSFTGRFFEFYLDSDVIDEVYQFHDRLLLNISEKKDLDAGSTMIEMLEHGASHLMEVLNGNHTS
jgi:GntR family transcriptional repressor for pyruvate dehydrogenase complex